MTVVTQSLSASQARRVFLNAQGLATKRGARRPRDADFAAYLAAQGVLQLDTVNVLARAHYLPLFSRLGPYDRDALDAYLWGTPDGHGAHTFEHWGHEASVSPRDLLPSMRHRMENGSSWHSRARERLERERPGLIAQVLAFVTERGPVTSSEVEHLSPRETKRGTWWDTSHVKDALDLLFITGAIASSRGRNFSRTYDSTDRAWGQTPVGAKASGAEQSGAEQSGAEQSGAEQSGAEQSGAEQSGAEGARGDLADGREWGLPASAAQQELFDRALAACGIGTPADLCDHFRLPLRPGKNAPDAAGGQAWAQSAVERGLAEWVEVEGWNQPAVMATGGPTPEAPWHRPASDPGRATGAALLSPFDPACWYRPKLERMFGMEYRIEIYTPAPKRVYGYYCLPFLMGDQMVGRVDLKADRKAGVLRVESAWREETPAPGARRRSDTEIASALARELALMGDWLTLDGLEVASRGNLAPALANVAHDR